MSGLLTYQPGGEMLIPCDLHGEHAATIPLDGGYACLECAKEAYKNAVRVASQVATLTAENAKLREEVVRIATERDLRAQDTGRYKDALANETRALRLDLARVTAERDGLVKAAEGVLHAALIQDAIEPLLALRAAVAAVKE